MQAIGLMGNYPQPPAEQVELIRLDGGHFDTLGGVKNVADIYPLTPTQNGILYHALHDSDPELYFEQVRCDLLGPLDLDRLKSAWSTVFQRHPALRTAFVWSGVKQPVQVVRETVELEFVAIEAPADLDRSDASAVETFLAELAAARRQQAFDLQRAPVSRFAVVRLGEDRTHFLWDFHHILLDGWSATSVFDEAIATYNSSKAVAGRGADHATPEPSTVPFRRYLEWLQTQDDRAAEGHWSAIVADHPGAPEVRLRPPVDGAARMPPRREHEISAATVERLRDFARANRITLNTVVQGAWAIVLGRYCDADDLTFGVVTSGRPAELDGVEDIVGMFLSALPLRVHLDDDVDVSRWLRSIQGQQLDSISHQHIGLAEIRRLAGLPPGEELFDSILVFENFPVSSPDSDVELTVADKQVFEQTHYGLTVMIRPGETLGISTLYDPARFGPDDIDRMLDLFIATLTDLVVSPERRPADLVSLLDTDRHLLERAADTDQFFDREATVHDLLVRMAERCPGTTAIVQHHDGASITFGELAHQSQRLAASLRSAGVRSGDAVGVSMPRSIDQVVALLGIWRAGAAYVPIDPDHPTSRRQLMVERAGVDLVIDRTEFDRLAECDAPRLDVTVDASAPACVIFTSGSTGEPKPVELHHRGLVNRFQWQLELHPMGPGETCAAKTTLNFVDHLWELWGPLLAGRPVVLLDETTVQDPKAFAAALVEHRIRRITLVPSLLEVALDALAAADVPLEFITVSGEVTSGRLAERVRNELPEARLFNFYGMSEGTADATWFEITGTVEPQRAVPIGRPLANARVAVLDRHRRPVPVGVAGELYVGGVGVACGYRGQRELTDQFFFDIAGERHYRTGDVGRWVRKPGGSTAHLEFLGRRDRQVKIRGVRVEPAEIEAELRRHPQIADAVVSTVGPAGRRQLVAHVVGTGSAESVDPSAVLGWARTALPAALVPSRILRIDAVPTLPTGKIDRAELTRLAANPPAAPDTGTDTPAPGDPSLTEAESQMVELWQEVLDRSEPIGLDDDFFDAGGDSLLAVRLFSQIDRVYGRDLPLAELFEAPTPRAMVQRLGPDTSSTPQTELPTLWLIASDEGRFDDLRRRLGRTVDVRIGAPSDLRSEISRSDRAIHIGGHASAASAALELGQELQAIGREVDTLLLIDAPLTRADFGSGPAEAPVRPKALYFFEPSESESRVPLLDSPELRERLDDRIGWSDTADEVDTILAPGTPDNLLAEPNVSWLANLISDRIAGSSTWHHLVPIGENDRPHRRLFAVHGEFGNVVGYRDLAVALGPAWSVIGVQAAGVHGTRPLHRSIEAMAEAYLEEVRRLQPEGPYLIGGYSSGGTVAYEMARRLTADGHQVEPVLWFDHYRVEALRSETKSKQLARIAGNRLKAALTDREAFQAGLKRRELQRKVDTIMAGDPTEREWWWSITELADDRAEAENLRRMLIGDNMRDVRSRYRHDRYDGPIVLYQAHTVDTGREPDRGWDDGEFDLERVPVPGDHTSLLLEPNVRAIADDLHRRFGRG